jgi:hypothetical protein
MLLTLVEIVAVVLLVLVIAVVITLCLAVAVSYVTQASYVDPLNESCDDD